MARIPDPVAGLIFRYGYLWLEEYRNGRRGSSKDRPACIIARVATGAQGIRLVSGASVEPGDVLIFPITSKPPQDQNVAIELMIEEKRLCKLTPDSPSWLIVSEFNADTWPNADLSLIPGTDRIDYGIARPGLMKRIGQRFAEARQANRVFGIKR